MPHPCQWVAHTKLDIETENERIITTFDNRSIFIIKIVLVVVLCGKIIFMLNYVSHNVLSKLVQSVP